MSIKQRLIELEEKVVKGLEEAFHKMVKMKTVNETPIVVSKKGKVVKMDSKKYSEREKRKKEAAQKKEEELKLKEEKSSKKN